MSYHIADYPAPDYLRHRNHSVPTLYYNRRGSFQTIHEHDIHDKLQQQYRSGNGTVVNGNNGNGVVNGDMAEGYGRRKCSVNNLWPSNGVRLPAQPTQPNLPSPGPMQEAKWYSSGDMNVASTSGSGMADVPMSALTVPQNCNLQRKSSLRDRPIPEDTTQLVPTDQQRESSSRLPPKPTVCLQALALHARRLSLNTEYRNHGAGYGSANGRRRTSFCVRMNATLNSYEKMIVPQTWARIAMNQS